MNDGPSIGLVLEGGGMRGLFTAGVIDELFGTGIRFGGIVGVSAGAAFGCNWKSRQPGRVLRYNLRYCRDRRYWGFGSLLRTGDLFNADFCYRRLPAELDPWDAAAFEADPSRFWAVATDADTGEAVCREIVSAGPDACEWIRASSSMPLVSRPVPFAGRRYLDGGLSDPIPLDRAFALGFDRVVLVLTRPADYRKTPVRFPSLLKRLLRRLPAVADALLARPGLYNRTLDRVAEAECEGRAFVIRPDAPLPVGRVTRSPAAVQSAYDLGRAAAVRALPSLRRWLPPSALGTEPAQSGDILPPR